MITVEERIRIFQEQKVVLWGAGDFGSRYLRQFQLYELNVVALCDNNTALQGTKIEGIPIISPKELQKIVEEDTSVVVQVTIDTTVTDTLEKEIQTQIESLGVKDYFAYSDEVQYMFDYMSAYKMVDVSSKFIGSQEEKKIRITKIDEELSIYKENKVVLCGGEHIEEPLLSLFYYHKIPIVAFCDIEETLSDSEVEGIPVISIEELKCMVIQGESVMIQSISEINEQKVVEKIESIGVANYVVYQEAYQILTHVKQCRDRIQTVLLRENPRITIDNHVGGKKLLEDMYSYMKDNNVKDKIFICIMGKTGDFTLINTFEKYNIKSFNTWHRPNLFEEVMIQELDKVKIITAVREPIGKMLSGVYQWLGALISNPNEVEKIKPFEIESILRMGGDVQYIVDRIVEWQSLFYKQGYSSVGSFMRRFEESVINIRQTPFNQERGWTIVKDGNIEVFMYQLEKMNEIIPDLSEFVGTPFDKWEMGNVAADKWIANSYKEAQKEIKISREYFDICYNDPYVKHFYSQEDIEKFKERWRSHIR